MKKLILLTLLAFTSLQVSAKQDEWNFKVYLNDDEIGYHRFLVEQRERNERVISEASYDVRLLFITAYSYRHTSLETWRNNCLVAIQSQTDDNGTEQYIDGSAQARWLRLSTHSGENQLQGCVKTFAYWNPAAMLKATRLLNSQTGEYTDVSTRFVGNATIPVAGKDVDSKQYRLEMEGFTINLWYSADSDRWLGLESTTSSGAVIKYRLQETGEQS